MMCNFTDSVSHRQGDAHGTLASLADEEAVGSSWFYRCFGVKFGKITCDFIKMLVRVAKA